MIEDAKHAPVEDVPVLQIRQCFVRGDQQVITPIKECLGRFLDWEVDAAERDVEVCLWLPILDEQNAIALTVGSFEPVHACFGELDVVVVGREHHLIDEDAVIGEDQDAALTYIATDAKERVLFVWVIDESPVMHVGRTGTGG